MARPTLYRDILCRADRLRTSYISISINIPLGIEKIKAKGLIDSLRRSKFSSDNRPVDASDDHFLFDEGPLCIVSMKFYLNDVSDLTVVGGINLKFHPN